MVTKPQFYTPEMVEYAVRISKETLINRGIDISNNTFYKKFENDPYFKKRINDSMTEKLNIKILNEIAAGTVANK